MKSFFKQTLIDSLIVRLAKLKRTPLNKIEYFKNEKGETK